MSRRSSSQHYYGAHYGRSAASGGQQPVAAKRAAGYTLLHELGALNDVNELTALGRELARLPVDPTLGRMLLQGDDGGHPVTRLPDQVAVGLEGQAQQRPDVGIVVDNEDLGHLRSIGR